MKAVSRLVPLLAGAVLLTAVLVRLWWAPEARALLGWTFPGIAHTTSAWVTILLANLRVAGGVLAAALVLDQAQRNGRRTRGLRCLLDALIALGTFRTALLIALALGAYGERMIRALLPHGPVELLAFALLASLYARARHAPVSREVAVRRSLSAVGLLLVAATLETLA